MRQIKAVCWLIVFVTLGFIQGFISPFTRGVAVVLAIVGSGKWKQWGINVWEGVDNAVSAELGGDPDESISSRLGKARGRKSKGWTYIANKLDLVALEIFNDADHCNKSIEKDEGKKQVTTY